MENIAIIQFFFEQIYVSQQWNIILVIFKDLIVDYYNLKSIFLQIHLVESLFYRLFVKANNFIDSFNILWTKTWIGKLSWNDDSATISRSGLTNPCKTVTKLSEVTTSSNFLEYSQAGCVMSLTQSPNDFVINLSLGKVIL